MTAPTASETVTEISVVVPVCDEQDNVGPLIAEIAAALPDTDRVEMIFVNDGSRDATAAALASARATHENLRVLTHDRRSGQSRAIRSGLLAARGRLVCVLDGDGQNDPADLPRLIEILEAAEARGEPIGMVQGEREKRRDSSFRRAISRFANACNRGLLRHQARDVGCGLKVLPRAVFLRLPYFDHMHRFTPALVGREGFTVLYERVNHRARGEGKSKYGTLDRALAGLIDLFGVYWLVKRSKRPTVSEE
jgi:dolichol-phosphate mannosyltransferase